MDKLDEEDEYSEKKENGKKLVSVENQVQIKPLNLKLLNNDSKNIFMVDKAKEDPSMSIQNIKKNLLENIKQNSNYLENI